MPMTDIAAKGTNDGGQKKMRVLGIYRGFSCAAISGDYLEIKWKLKYYFNLN